MVKLNILDTAGRLIIAAILGGVIGWERQRKGSSAGLRTHILVCEGAALIMLVSMYIFHAYEGVATVDPSRIAAGVVTSIGFLGAGAILRSMEDVKGLTTAASIWASSGIGLAVGCGYIVAALIATAISFVTLFFLKGIEAVMNKEDR